jgi:PHD/YefM family antitoxin component YafN of YafNO toxin-antitoxin module
MRIAPVADVKARLSAYLQQCQTEGPTEGPVVITRNGKAAAVLLAPANDEDLETLLLARSPRFQALLAKSRESIQAGKGLSSRDFWKAVAHRHRRRADPKQVSETSPPGGPKQSAPAAARSRRRRG